MTMREIVDRIAGRNRDLSRQTTEMTPELREALVRLVEAWTVPGPSPEFHYHSIDALEQDWPTLAKAIKGVIASFLT